MIQIDIKKPSMCRLTDEEGRIHKCPFLNGEYECILQGCISYWTWERQYKNCPLHEVTDTDTISRQAAIDEIKNADVVVLYYDGEPIDEAIERAIKAVKRSVVASIENLSSTQPEDICSECDAWNVYKNYAQPEIIHCGECKHRDPEDHKCDCGHDIIWQLPRDEKWYCADAERRTDEHDDILE